MDFQPDQNFRSYFSSMIQAAGSPGDESYSSSSVSEYDDTVVPSAQILAASRGIDFFYDHIDHQQYQQQLQHQQQLQRNGVSYEEEEVAAPSNLARAGGVVKKEKKRKQKKDPNKPKGWLTANLTYANAHRPRIKEENPDATFGDIARLLSAEYKALSPGERAVWEKKSAEDRARYDAEMLAYLPPARVSTDGNDGSDSDDLEENTVEVQVPIKTDEESGEEYYEEEEPKKKKAKKEKKVKDPNCPKRGLSAWQIYSTGQAKDDIKAEFPESTWKERMIIMGGRFKALPPDESQRLKDASKADKARYEREMEAYSAVKQLASLAGASASGSDTDDLSV